MVVSEKSTNFATEIQRVSTEDMKIREIFEALEQFAPLSLQESYDHTGLQIGLTEDANATGVLLCLDVTEDVITEATQRVCNVVISHHPLLFHPLAQVTQHDYVGRTLTAAIRAGVNVYAAHTNLDNAAGGVCHKMAAQLCLRDTMPLVPLGTSGHGNGLIGNLSRPHTPQGFLQQLKEAFRVPCVRHNDWTGHTVQRVALCGGAGASLISEALQAKADVFVTGEIGYHRFFGQEHQMLLCEIGHFESEQYTVQLLHELLHQWFPDLTIHETQHHTNPIHYC